MYSLLLLSSLLHITTCTVYTVTPDDHYYPNATCHHCHNLQHYLLNITKYFTSNTQLLFLPGLHHLHTDLIIQNVHNISLIGSTANGTTLDTVIQCNSSSILIFNISKLALKNIRIYVVSPRLVPLTIMDCSFVSLYRLCINIQKHRAWKLDLYKFALLAINIIGDSCFSHVECEDEIQLLYNETHTANQHHSLLINNCVLDKVKLDFLQISYKIELRIINMQLHKINGFIHAEELGSNKLIMINCQFISFRSGGHLLSFASTSNGSVQFINCQFITSGGIFLYNRCPYFVHQLAAPIQLLESVNVEFNNCYFQGNNVDRILQTHGTISSPINLVIRNTNYTSRYSEFSHDPDSFISLLHTKLTLVDSVNFYDISYFDSVISVLGNSTIIISGTVNFLRNHGHVLIELYDNIQYIIITENSIVNISHNKVWSFFEFNPPITKYPYPFCFFQYISSSTSEMRMKYNNFLIQFYNNQCKYTGCYKNMTTANCLWLSKSLFNSNKNIPLEVNNQYIQFINNSGIYKLSQIIEQSSLCMCTNKLHYDCHINDLGYLYPGQTLSISLYQHKDKVDTANAVVVKIDITQQYVTPCIVLNANETLQSINNQCTNIQYTIGFSTNKWCEIFLKIASDSDEYLNIFYIRQMTCPTGFVKIDKRCQCDPVLVQYGITNCNINDQTIIRPANSWISVTTHNNSYTYHISLHCSYQRCLPHSSHLNFSNPNSQCKFNRSDMLCGHCQQGLSTVFSSFKCQHCSNIYLLLIIPIAIAGLMLVLLLFIFNLTVTEGSINGFILYVNIISINTSVIFAEINHFTPTYTFISIANLDLGIQTCFYNGMDDYAKMWLQLAFPFYLIFIATLIIIISRYSTTIQRLTARRALPVLATLFLLSYTKFLHIVCSVLFFYSTITHLPSKHSTLVWSVDANVPLFGVRFTILFIVCVILFLILVPLNVILLFTRTLSRFRFINKFKPLLDAYQGPYKNKSYYWTGLQLLIRVVFFGISSLDRNINIAISIILLSIIIGLHGVMQPFKIKYKNYQELLLFFNLHGLYVSLSYTGNQVTAVNIMITMAAFHFSLIIVYHMITYVCGGVIKNKILFSVNTLTKWITRLRSKQPQQFQLQDNIRDNIPEVAFNYREYREPLVGMDC